MDLAEVCYGDTRFGVRRLKALVENLPPEAMTFGRWFMSANELAAMQIEWVHLLLQATWANFRLKVKDPSQVKIPDPFRIPRPGESPTPAVPEKPGMTLDSVRIALLGGG